MDANLIYRKTPAGEAAVRQRTRVVQRNMRMVLILVDGRSTVADLCEKAGNPQLVDTALQELERDGLIAPLSNEPEAVAPVEPDRAAAVEIRAAAVQRLVPGEPASVPASGVRTVPEPFSIGPASVLPAPAFPSGFGPSSLAPPSPKLAAERAARPDLAGQSGRPDDGEPIGPMRRGGGRRLYLSRPLLLAIATAVLVILPGLVFLVFPYDRYRPAVEGELGRLLGQSVHVRQIGASLSPRPAIVLEGVAVGDGEGVRAARIRLLPEWLSLLGARPAFASVEIEAASIDGAAVGLLPKALAGALRPDAPAAVRSVVFSRLQLSLPGLLLADLQGESQPDEAGAAPALALHNPDRSLRLLMRSAGTGVAVDFEGYGWQPLPDSPYRFDSLQGRLAWDGRSLQIGSLDARIFDGAVQGALQVERLPSWRLSGQFEVKHMGLRRLTAALGYPEQFDGELAGTFGLSATADDWRGLLKTLVASGEFAMQRGSLGGFDLVEAVRRAGKGTVAGGATRYERLAGRFGMTFESLRLSEIALSSGALHAGGALEIAQGGKLSGRLDVEMRGSAAVVRMPVALGATLRSPVLRGGR